MSLVKSVFVPPVTQIVLALGMLWGLYLCIRIIYNIYWHPLAKFPGPKLSAATWIPYCWAIWLGNLPMSIKKLHDHHGHVVRISPNILSFNTAQSWKDIYGHQSGRMQLPKDPRGPIDHVPSLINLDDADHAKVRGLLSPAFSERAMREQESLVMGHINLLIQRLKAQIQGPVKGEVDLVRWYNFTTFDIIGDLAISQPFGSLESGDYHVWIFNLFKGVKYLSVLEIGTVYPIIGAVFSCVHTFFPKFGESQEKHREYTEMASQTRLTTKTEKKDFVSYIPRDKESKGMTDDEITENVGLFMVAGSETTATLLSGATYYLLTNPVTLNKLCNEVRNAFKSKSDITFSSVTRLPYLSAVIEESLRMYPPVPTTRPRRTLPEGNIIDGHFVPGNTTVGINHWATYQSKDNFRDPEKFIPERWLDDRLAQRRPDNQSYAGDQRAALQPFSSGQRNCIGKTLAYAEMRSILAQMLWHFDMELCDSSKKWADQRAFMLWDKPALLVKLRQRTLG